MNEIKLQYVFIAKQMIDELRKLLFKNKFKFFKHVLDFE